STDPAVTRSARLLANGAVDYSNIPDHPAKAQLVSLTWSRAIGCKFRPPRSRSYSLLARGWGVGHDYPRDQVREKSPPDKQGCKQPDQPNHRRIQVQIFGESGANTGDLTVT